MFAVPGGCYLAVLPGWLGPAQTNATFSPRGSAESVLMSLGTPLASGYLSRRWAESAKGRCWCEARDQPSQESAFVGRLAAVIGRSV